MDCSTLPSSVAPVVQHFKENPLPHQGPPMLYQSFKELDHSRLPDVIESIRGAEDMFCDNDIPRDAYINTGITKEQEHNSHVMLGLVYMMVGGVDEAHDLVLPYSLPCDTEWGGPAVLDSPALGNATYCHALVHRTEGHHVGELEMVGWDNARSWFSETPSDHPMFTIFSHASESLGRKQNFSDTDKKLCDKMKRNGSWNWRSLTDLFSRSSQSQELTSFCDKLHNSEIEMLFNHCNRIVNSVRK